MKEGYHGIYKYSEVHNENIKGVTVQIFNRRRLGAEHGVYILYFDDKEVMRNTDFKKVKERINF